MRRGHSVTMYTDEGRDLMWLPNTLTWKHTKEAATDPLDVLIWSDTPDEPYWSTFNQSPASVKAYCMMGFGHNNLTDNIFLTKKHNQLARNFWMLCDGSWQLEHIAKFTDNLGPAIGGVNTKQFRPVDTQTKYDVMCSGDPRPRKGTDTIMEACSGLSVGTYFKKRIKQEDMAAAICQAPIFVDGHTRGGFCNPVLEAMACGRAVVCTDTPCNRDFAFDMINCIKVPESDPVAMRKAIDDLMADDNLREMLSAEALKTAQRFDYDVVVIPLEEAMLKRLNA